MRTLPDEWCFQVRVRKPITPDDVIEGLTVSQLMEQPRPAERRTFRDNADGEKAFVDYSGKKPQLVDPTTGEIVDVELFVMVLPDLRQPLLSKLYSPAVIAVLTVVVTGYAWVRMTVRRHYARA